MNGAGFEGQSPTTNYLQPIRGAKVCSASAHREIYFRIQDTMVIAGKICRVTESYEDQG